MRKKSESKKPNLNGRLRASFQELHAAGCIQTLADVEKDLAVAYERYGDKFNWLVNATRGNPCDGCPVLVNSKGVVCSAYKQYHTACTKTSSPVIQPRLDNTHQAETVRAEAKRRNLSLGEVRRQRAAKRQSSDNQAANSKSSQVLPLL